MPTQPESNRGRIGLGVAGAMLGVAALTAATFAPHAVDLAPQIPPFGAAYSPEDYPEVTHAVPDQESPAAEYGHY